MHPVKIYIIWFLIGKNYLFNINIFTGHKYSIIKEKTLIIVIDINNIFVNVIIIKINKYLMS